MDFDVLRTFLAVVETGGVSAAARRLGLARSVVSKRISDLEAELGAALFVRSTSRMAPTDAADAFYARASRILQEFDEAADEVRGDGAELRGLLRVAAPVSFSIAVLNDAVIEFAAAHPELRVALDLDDRMADLAGGGYDLGVRIAEHRDSALKARKLAECPLYLCAAPGLLASRGEPERIEDFASFPTIAYANAPSVHVWRLGGCEVRLAPRITANNGEAIFAAALAGLGAAFLPAFLAAPAIRDGRLARLLPDEAPPTLDLLAAFPAGREKTRRVRAFVDFLVDRFAGAAPWAL